MVSLKNGVPPGPCSISIAPISFLNGPELKPATDKNYIVVQITCNVEKTIPKFLICESIAEMARSGFKIFPSSLQHFMSRSLFSSPGLSPKVTGPVVNVAIAQCISEWFSGQPNPLSGISGTV